MADKLNLTLNEKNDEEVLPVLRTNQPDDDTPLNLTGLTLEAFLKVSAATSDTDPGTWKGTSGGGEIVVLNAVTGEVSVTIPAASVNTSMGWWRLDVLDGALRKTALYGTVTVTDL